MATGGPFTDNARGVSPIGFDRPAAPAPRSVTGYTDAEMADQVDQFAAGYQEAAGPGMMSDRVPAQAAGQPAAPAQSTRPAMDNPMTAGNEAARNRPQQQGGGGGMRARVGAPNYGGARMTKQDFISNPNTWLVDGHQFSMPSFEMPASAIALRLQAMNQEEKELNDAAASLFDTGEATKVKAPYAQSYNNLMMQADRDFVDALINQYGSEAKARRAIVKDPVVRAAYKHVGQNLNTIAQVINHDYDEAEVMIKNMNDGTWDYEPKAYQSAIQLTRGFGQLGHGGLGDIPQLMADTTNYRRHTALPKYLRESGWDDHIKDFMARTFKDAEGNSTFKRTPGGKGFTVFSWEDQKNAEAQIDQIAEREYPRFSEIYPSREEFKQALRAMYPIQVDLKTEVRANPQLKGSSKPAPKRGWSGGAYSLGNGIRMVPSYDGTQPGVDASGDQVATGQFRIRLYKDSRGEQVDLAPQEFLNDKGQPVFMKPTQVVQEGSGWFIEGPEYGRPREQAKGAGGSKEGIYDKFSSLEQRDGPADRTEFVPLGTVRVPLEKNPEFVVNYGDPDQVMREYLSGNEGAQPAKQTMAQPKDRQKRQDGAMWSAKYGAWVKQDAEGKWVVAN